MSVEVTYLGYTCPRCGQRVVVLCSCWHPPIEFVTKGQIESKCKCGLERTIPLGDVRNLDVWTEYPVTVTA
jgi:transcription elongation factor Elf1